MVAKIISVGKDRDEALARLKRAVKGSQIVIKDGTTNKSFLLELLNHPVFEKNEVNTRWLDESLKTGELADPDARAAAIIMGSIEIYSRILHEERQEFFQTVSRGRPQRTPVASTREVELKMDGVGYKLELLLLEPEYYRVYHEGNYFDVRLIRDSHFNARIYYNQKKYKCTIMPKQDDFRIEVEGMIYLIEQDSGGVVKSNSPAVVLSLQVEPGQIVKEGEPILSLEAMKMEMVFLAPSSGCIREIFVKKNDQVSAGDPLLVIEAGDGAETTSEGGDAVSFRYNTLPEKPRDPVWQVLRECKDFMMGFDVYLFSFDDMLENFSDTVRKIAAMDGGLEELADFLNMLYELYFDIEFLFLKKVSVSETDISSPEQNFYIYLQLMRTGKTHPAEDFLDYLKRALAYYDVEPEGQSEALEEALIRLFYSHHNVGLKRQVLQTVHRAYLESGAFSNHARLRSIVDTAIENARVLYRDLYDMMVDFYYQMFEKSAIDTAVDSLQKVNNELLDKLVAEKDAEEKKRLALEITYSPQSLLKYLIDKLDDESTEKRRACVEILMRRIHLEQTLLNVDTRHRDDVVYATAHYVVDRASHFNITLGADLGQFEKVLGIASDIVGQSFGHREIVVDVYLKSAQTQKEEDYVAIFEKHLSSFPRFPLLSRIRVILGDGYPVVRCFHYQLTREGYRERRLYRGIPEMLADRLFIERLQGFQTQRLPTNENVYLFYCVAEENQKDRRFIAFSEVREPPQELTDTNRFSYLALRRAFLSIIKSMRQEIESHDTRDGFYWNQIIIYIRPLLKVPREEFLAYLRRIITGYEKLHLERIRIYALFDQPYGDVANLQVEVSFPGNVDVEFRYSAPTTPLIEPLSQRDFRHALSRRRRLNYPYEIVDILTGGYFSKGEFEEFDLVGGEDGELKVRSVKGREEGQNRLGIVFGIITNYTALHPEGMQRVLLLGDGNFGLGCLAEMECRYVMAALELAEQKQIPVEWFPVSSGAKISMENGTENLDWTAHVLREIIHFTQKGGEINIIVDAINVGAQSYWNAEATMMMHNCGCLIMTPRGCMVLTGKSALDYAGSVSAEDNIGIGGLQRVMGPNGQAHYAARDLLDACRILFRYYAFTFRQPGEAFPRSYAVPDPVDRNVCEEAYSFHLTPDFSRIGDIFDDATNPGKKKPFDMRQVMQAVADRGQNHLERWPLQADADTAIVWDTTLGGICVSMLGIQSYPIKRHGEIPNDGPDTWTGGTLFPMSSRKLARALNSASGRRPVVILANLSGFDGSPESLKRLQLEFGAEIGRAVVNFKGPLVFCVLSRYHGGAYVVFSNVLNKGLKAIALEGTFASVIGGAPAAAVVFPRVVRKKTLADERLKEIQDRLEIASGEDRAALQNQYQEVYKEVYGEKQGEVAADFESVHTVARARDVGSLDDIINPTRLRPHLIQLVKEGMDDQD